MYAAINDRPQERSHPTALPTRPAALLPGVGKELRLPRGQTLFFDEDDAAYFFEIVSGNVRCCRLTQDGRRQIHRFAGPGELLGLSGEDSYGYSAEAVTDIVVRRHRLASLDSEMARDGVLRRRVLQALRDELAATRTQMMLLGRMSATEKLSSFLLALAGRSAARGACIELPMTRSDIADYLGLTIETVSRKLNELRALGVITLETATRVRITDHDRIEAIADAA
jgi:CRP/FNR family transcriptional regulator